MQSTGSHREKRKNEKISAAEFERRDQDRRREHGEGYTYIPKVGWYCRRKIARRSNEIEH